MNNSSDIKIPPADLTKALDLAKQLSDLLQPYLLSLTPDERQSIPKMADKSVAFVTKALMFAESNPRFAPQDLDVTAMHNDVQTVSDLHLVETPVLVLAALLHDTIIEMGSEAYIAALAYYSTVQSAAKRNVPGAAPIANELKVRFEQSRKKKED